jgi:hypothetical protein
MRQLHESVFSTPAEARLVDRLRERGMVRRVDVSEP